MIDSFITTQSHEAEGDRLIPFAVIIPLDARRYSFSSVEDEWSQHGIDSRELTGHMMMVKQSTRR